MDGTPRGGGTQAIQQAEQESPLGAPSERDTLAEAEVIEGHGAETVMDYQPVPTGLARSVSSLRSRDFRLFWGGQLVSLVGTWMQVVAQSWLVLELSNSAFILGVLSALQFLPILIFSIFGGVIADRRPKRSILLVTQSASLLLAVALAVLAQLRVVNIAQVMALAFLLGVVNAVDMPTRQAFVVELVGPQDLQNAIALNSAAFNSARLVGPAIAGVAIGAIGVAGCFYLNAVSFVAAIAGLVAITAGRRSLSRGTGATSVREDLREGIAFVLHTPLIWLTIALVAIEGTFGMNFGVLVPVEARVTLHLGASGFGFLAAISGVGSLVAALLLAAQQRPFGRTALLVSGAALGVTQIVLGFTRTYAPAAAALAAVGFSMVFFAVVANTLLQRLTPDALRGRVMSVYATVFAGTTPLGSLFAGAVAQAWGPGAAFAVGGLLSALAAFGGVFVARRP